MKKYLIVANQTLGGESLEHEVTERLERGDATFYVVVPATAIDDHSGAWSGGYKSEMAEVDKAHAVAEQRLRQMVDKLKSLGAQADGEVGHPDPKRAVQDVLDDHTYDRTYDEVIVSTLPRGLSGWLKADVPSQVAAVAGGLVTTVEAR